MKLYKLYISVTTEKSKLKVMEYEAVEKKAIYECKFIDPDFGVDNFPNSIRKIKKEKIGKIDSGTVNLDNLISFYVWIDCLSKQKEFEEKLKLEVSKLLIQKEKSLNLLKNSLSTIL